MLIIVRVETTKPYEAERRRLLRRRTLSACIIASILVPLFGVVDYFMYRADFATLMGARLVSSIFAFGLWLLARTRFGRHQPAWIAMVMVIQAGFAITGVPILVTGTNTPHYVSASLLILSVAALLPWRPGQVAILTAALMSMFVVTGLLHGALPGAVEFGTQASAIFITGVLGIVISWFAERTRHFEFRARRELKAASKEKTQLIQNLEKMAARLANVNEDLQERQRETNDFLYVLSHDLRAPLINIQGFGRRLYTDMSVLEGCLTNGSADEAPKRLGRMQQSLQFLNAGTAKIDQLITRLLEVARVSTRVSEHSWIDAKIMVGDVVDACRFQLEASGVEVSVGDLPRVWADPVQLNQVFTNLVDNAVKYMGASAHKRIEVSCTTKGERYRFAVSDTGPGIAAKDQEKVFRLFARAGSNGTSGEGVGLATVRAIVNRHGGRIWVESTPGEGCTFYFTLPRDAAQTSNLGSPNGGPASRPVVQREEMAAHV